MILYIDPGTGSMLFTILIGVLGALAYAFRNVFVKLRFVLSGGKRTGEDEHEYPYVIFTDSKRYWNVFQPICEEMERREQKLLYLTASADDPALEADFRFVRAEFAGEGNKKYFNGKSTEEKIKIDQQLYMIGYNAGLMLANTEKGISVQMTSGRVTQTPDGERITYSIPTVQGSSGSPVIDDKGNVVAVNFAKLMGSDNFNFGIPLEKIKEFLK